MEQLFFYYNGDFTDSLLNTYLTIQTSILGEFLYTKEWRQQEKKQEKSFCWPPANANEKNFFGAYSHLQPECTRLGVANQ